MAARTAGGAAAVNASRPFTTDAPKTGADAKAGAINPQLEATFKAIEGLLGDDLVKSNGGLFQFELKGGSTSATPAFMSGKLKIKGDLGLAMKLEKLLKKTQAKL